MVGRLGAHVSTLVLFLVQHGTFDLIDVALTVVATLMPKP